jgi:hypothetical protein
MYTRKLILGLAFLLLAAGLTAQSLSIAEFEMEASGYQDADTGNPVLETDGVLAGRFAPVNTIVFSAKASFMINDTAHFLHPSPDFRQPGSVSFDGASVLLPYLLGNFVDLAVFTGDYDDPASGTLLRSLLKKDLPEPEFFDMPAGSVFSSDTGIAGTGIALTAAPGNRNYVTGLYMYWNAATGSDAAATGDFCLGSTGPFCTYNAFIGASSNLSEPDMTLRGGATSLFTPPGGNDLYLEFGTRSYTPGETHLDRTLYMLFEPRIHWARSDLFLSFFSAPIEETDGNYLGANILFGYGRLDVERMRGGISILGSIDPQNPGTLTPFTFSVSPFYSIMRGSFVLDITAVIKPLLLDDLASAGELQIGLKAVY